MLNRSSTQFIAWATQFTEQLNTLTTARGVPRLRKGDILQIKGRKWYNLLWSHYAIVVDDDNVIHVTKIGRNIIITKEKLAQVFSKRKFVRINNMMDGEFPVLNIQDIIYRAKSMIDHDKWHYDLLAHNCEHFVTWCRYGKKISMQTLSIVDYFFQSDLTMKDFARLWKASIKGKWDSGRQWIKAMYYHGSSRSMYRNRRSRSTD